MRGRVSSQHPLTRRGAAVVELAVVLPLMMFLFVVAIDYCRLFYFSQIVANCARNGAMYESDPLYKELYSPYKNAEEAAKADVQKQPAIYDKLKVQPPKYSSDASGNYCDVTVEYEFDTITKYPGIPSKVPLSRTVRVRVAPALN